ncbi:Sterol 24-C-methyltransferase [Hondaea fermentalgiana]|uniref:Sterol 24-C-methyltransferase n=1 Tax=Hondaea fermentalgiana TaxID=2315210 RepID=A0A2R5G6F4_9STRA|nr:Sterol 24-C-methyltransferase [Hondaea fermentalgiana]|eukprot:GBG26105.1 Sterol 24-C-methyltransferase [Hondaea fermentalgiana]
MKRGMKEVYTHGHHASVVNSHAKRTAESCAAFLLRRNICQENSTRLLDVGCGPGTITAGLAKYCAKVDALDNAPEIVERARAEAERAHVADKVSVQAASVYELPFEDETFDVVYTHQVLQHLVDPVAALVEMRRVLKVGGVVAVREADYSSMLVFPEMAAVDMWRRVYRATCVSNKAQPDAGRYLRHWAMQAGFGESALDLDFSTVSYTTLEECREWGQSWQQRALHSAFSAQAQEYGHASKEELQRMSDDWAAWAEKPGACFYYVNGEILATKE